MLRGGKNVRFDEDLIIRISHRHNCLRMSSNITLFELLIQFIVIFNEIFSDEYI